MPWVYNHFNNINSSNSRTQYVFSPVYPVFGFYHQYLIHTPRVYVCLLHIKWISCRQHIHGSFFFRHSATLCLVIKVFSPLTFKLNNNSYVFISILLIVWGFSIILFHFFLLLLLTSLVNWWLSLGLGLVISLIFCVWVSIRFLVYGKHYICKLMISNLNTF